MAIETYGRARPDFEPDAKQLNAVKGFLVALIDWQGLDCSASSAEPAFPDVSWGWLARNVPNANQRVNELVEAGWVWVTDWGSDYSASMGLDDPAIDWLEANLGMPKVESEEYLDEAFQAWVKREIKPTFTRKGHRDGRSGSKEVKNHNQDRAATALHAGGSREGNAAAHSPLQQGRHEGRELRGLSSPHHPPHRRGLIRCPILTPTISQPSCAKPENAPQQ